MDEDLSPDDRCYHYYSIHLASSPPDTEEFFFYLCAAIKKSLSLSLAVSYSSYPKFVCPVSLCTPVCSRVHHRLLPVPLSAFANLGHPGDPFKAGSDT